MKNYTDNDYALNKFSKGIVYRFADGIVEITLEEYLLENPDKTEADFAKLKALSDEDYLDRDRTDYQQTWKNVSLHGLDETSACAIDSPENEMFEQIEHVARQKKRVLAETALGKLTEVQRRRYVMYHVNGLSTWKIAEIEKVNQSKIMKSLTAAEKKITIFLKNS